MKYSADMVFAEKGQFPVLRVGIKEESDARLRYCPLCCILYNKAEEANTHTHTYAGKKDNFCLDSIMMYIEVPKDTTEKKTTKKNHYLTSK